MWRLRIEQYFQVQDYAIWDVIENGNSFKLVAQTTTNTDGTSTSLIPGPITTEEKTQKKNDVKARSMLLMALPNEHLMTFNQYKDAKTLFAAIQTRFGGKEATKKTQKTLLKQMYENFSATSTESLDSIFNRLQEIVSQLAILGENISQEDLNLKILRSLPSEWNTHVVVWRNKPDLDTMSFDDLYNNFKIVEQEVKGNASSISSSSSQNMVFVSSPSSTNEVNTAYGVSTANTQVSPVSTQVSTASTQVSTANLSDDTVYAFLTRQPNGSQLVYEDLEQIHEEDIEKMDLKWQLALLSMRTRRGPRNQDSKNRNQDSSRRTINVEETSSKAMVAIDGAGFDWSYMADDEVPTNMALMAFSDSEFNKSEFNLANYKRGLAYVDEQLVFYKKNEVIFCEQLAVLKRDISYKDLELSMLKSEVIFTPNLDLSNSGLEEFQQPEFEGYGPKTSKNDSEDTSNVVRESPDALIVEKLVLTVITIKGKGWNLGIITRVKYNYSAKNTHPSAHRNMVPRAVLMKTGLKAINIGRPVTTAHPKTTVYSARPMSHFSKSAQSTVKRPYQIRTTLTNKNFSQKVNTSKGKFYTAWPKVVNTARPNSTVVNAIRVNQVHMTGNMSYLSNFKEFNGGYVTFGGGAKGGKITGKGTLKTANESQVLLKVPRKNNMYSVDMKNIVPKECLTCLVAKATLDESMLWHRRLGHVNFKTINKLVKKNLVRGLPSKRFENDQTCVACLKGKQHKASFVTDDYSRFTWVFFLATKDDTSGILKRFITEIENLVDKKVKIIRCDNGTKFKNRVITDSKLPTTFWAKAVNVAYYVQNRVLVVKRHNKTPYELFRGRTPALSFMRPFGCHVTILNTSDYLGKFDGKSDEGFFVGYLMNSKAFKVYNIRIRKVEENLHIRFLEDKPIIAGDRPKWLFDIKVLTKSMNYVQVIAGINSNDLVRIEESIGAGHSSKEIGSSQDYILMPLWKDGSLFDSSLKNASNDEPQPSSDAKKKDNEGVCKESEIVDQEKPKNSTQEEPKKLIQALKDPSWIEAMQEELLQFKLQQVWTLMDLPHGKRSIGIKCVYRNKKDERGILIRNKARLVAQGYTQEEGMDYDEVFAPVARIEAIRLFLAYASFKDFVVYQMDVKSAFLYGKIEEEVYVCQPLGFEDPEFPDRVYKVEKALYGLHQAPKAFKVSLVFISQDKYVDEFLKKFGFSTVKTASTPMETSKSLLKDAEAEDVDVYLYRSMIGSLMYLTSSRPDIMFDVCQPKLGLWYLKDSPFDLEAYSDSDYVGASLDRKSTTGGKDCQWEVQIQALVDEKKVIVTETSVRRALQLKDAEGTECLPNATIFAELERMGYENLTGKLTFYKAFFSPQWKLLIHIILQCLSAKTTTWNEFSSTMASAIICLAINQKFNFSKYIFDNMVKNLEGGVKFLMYPRFVQVFLDKQVEGMTKHKEIYVTPSHTKKVFANMKREGKGFSGRVTPLFETMMVQDPEELEPITDEAANEEHVPVHSNDPLFSGEDRLKLNELMELCTNLSQRVLDLENTMTSQAAEITKLKERVKKLERRNKSRTPGLKRSRKVGRSAQVVSSEDEGLGAQEDASKQGRKIADLDADAEEVEVEKVVSTADVTTTSATTTVDELTLAHTLIEIKASKPKDVTRPKARGVVVQEPSEFTTTTSQPSQFPQAKDKGKAKMMEPEKPLKKKDLILVDEEIAQRLQEELQAELEEKERLARQKEEEDNLIS
ncbi:retrovirus-related pol polyprotein from transposon TNT 1-94 [Tanacetum coccineum]|uniref:Retrovirus-related pol polyprotein from transposon TNT 1-94 n=1 Tax=Tanacetum coccineum TaxID=301880 RepID=A0ABQ5EGE0_9ASTR